MKHKINSIKHVVKTTQLKFLNLSARNQVGVFNSFIILPIIPFVLVLFPVKNIEIGESNTNISQENVAGINDVVVPDETPIDKETYEWIGESDNPKFLSIPSINAAGFVENVGLDPSNEISVPSNTHLAGWYNASALPGDPGLAIIDGHVDGYLGAGIFAELTHLNSGDEYTLETGSGEILKYRVIDIRTTTVKESVNILFSQEPTIKSQLNLITCGGNYDRANRSYDERVIVISELV